VALRFAGDVFEMEDQRNWTDASFKTYGRPLARAFPYRIGPGERVRQSVTIEARTSSGPIRSETGPVRIALIAGGVFPSMSSSAARRTGRGDVLYERRRGYTDYPVHQPAYPLKGRRRTAGLGRRRPQPAHWILTMGVTRPHCLESGPDPWQSFTRAVERR
jgi:hypothetical protein